MWVKQSECRCVLISYSLQKLPGRTVKILKWLKTVDARRGGIGNWRFKTEITLT